MVPFLCVFLPVEVKFAQHKIHQFNHFKVQNSEAFSKLMTLCNHHHYQNILIIPKGNPVPIKQSLHIP